MDQYISRHFDAFAVLGTKQNKTKSNNISNSILASSSSENFSHILQYFVCRILIVKFLKVHGIRLISSCSNWICSQVNIEWPKRLNLHYSLEKRENFENFVVMCISFMSNQFGINFNLMQNLFEPPLLHHELMNWKTSIWIV